MGLRRIVQTAADAVWGGQRQAAALEPVGVYLQLSASELPSAYSHMCCHIYHKE